MAPDGTALELIRTSQRVWAERRFVGLRDPHHTQRIEDNLFGRHLSESARSEFTLAAGHELGDPKKPEARPGLSALLSSAALVYNVFEHRRGRDLRPLADACGAHGRVTTLELEQRFPIWRGGTPPHLDVVLTGPKARPTAIEAKFTEPYGSVSNAFRPVYFEREAIWTTVLRQNSVRRASG